MMTINSKRGLSVALFMTAAVALGACAKKPKDAVNGSLSGAGASSSTAKPGSAQDFVVNVGDRVLFTTDSSSVNADGRVILDRQAQWLNQYGQYTFTIEGHADERGTREYNLALGARRATAVKRYLVSKGVSSGRMKSLSFGKERPVSVCNDISCWSQNRRAVTVLNGAGS
ncbi:MAG: peptidoglycan-associated lipoprotein Pal [Hyphomicrobiales bacterium]